MGKKGEAKYRVVVKEKRSKRDGIATEILGWYTKGLKTSEKKINKDRYDYWVSKGAKPSETVRALVQA